MLVAVLGLLTYAGSSVWEAPYEHASRSDRIANSSYPGASFGPELGGK